MAGHDEGIIEGDDLIVVTTAATIRSLRAEADAYLEAANDHYARAEKAEAENERLRAYKDAAYREIEEGAKLYNEGIARAEKAEAENERHPQSPNGQGQLTTLSNETIRSNESPEPRRRRRAMLWTAASQARDKALRRADQNALSGEWPSARGA